MAPAKNLWQINLWEGIMKELLHRLWVDDDGQDIAEYAPMLTTILLIVAMTISAIGNNSNSIFSAVAGKLTSG